MARSIRFPACFLSLMMTVGCAASVPNGKEPLDETVSMPILSSAEVLHRFDYWHEEATELHEMAARREREADVIAKNKQESSAKELATHMRALARQLHAAAEYADRQAQEAQRQVQHAMTQ
jgi:hypothetical protein